MTFFQVRSHQAVEKASSQTGFKTPKASHLEVLTAACPSVKE
jgi:hypothetical protein